MTRIAKDPGHSLGSRSPSTNRPGPDYEAGADRGRLELGGDALDRMAFTRDGGRTLADQIAAASGVTDARAAMTYDLESRGGFAHAVRGIVVYLDEEAQTYVMRASDGKLHRVPIRDIQAVRGIVAGRDAVGPYDALDEVSKT